MRIDDHRRQPPGQRPGTHPGGRSPAAPGADPHGIGGTCYGPAGAVLSTLRKALGLVDGIEELSVPYGDVHLGIPLLFSSGQAVRRLPPLTRSERLCLDSAAGSLRDAYAQLPALSERIAT
ncbi:hypothetical protein ACFVW2_34185 [Streptomyces sp. NPDC058171]